MFQKIAHPILSYTLVIIQFLCLGLLLLLEPILTFNYGLALQIMAVLIGLSALLVMHLGHFNIIPDPRPNADLVTHGPYHWIRHPMYSSILLFFLPTLLQTSNLLSWEIYTVLIINLLIKLHYEEYLLKQNFSDYADYQTHSKKLIPYIY